MWANTIPILHWGSSCLHLSPLFTCWNFYPQNAVLYHEPLLHAIFLFLRKQTDNLNVSVDADLGSFVQKVEEEHGTAFKFFKKERGSLSCVY
jgi:hypothetical protein